MNTEIIALLKELVKVLDDPTGLYINGVLAVITLGAVLIALFQERIKKFFNRTKLQVQIHKCPPSFIRILATNRVTEKAIGYIFYSRILILNKDKLNVAKNVEVFISHFWEIDDTGKRNEIKTFIPMNLRWSNTHETRTTILPDSRRYCDLGFFGKKDNGSLYFKLDTIVQPNQVADDIIPNIINPGNYEFEIAVSGENVLPQKKTWSFSFPKKWQNKSDEDIMIKEIQIRERS